MSDDFPWCELPDAAPSAAPIRNPLELEKAFDRCDLAQREMRDLVRRGVFMIDESAVRDIMLACTKGGSPEIFYDASGNERMANAPEDVQQAYKQLQDKAAIVSDGMQLAGMNPCMGVPQQKTRGGRE